ncbi:MAG TPA: carboxypeptidase-like regulatory domain-containing protein [Pyrinomonadaceae bacterium]|jgi:hypothetical protein
MKTDKFGILILILIFAFLLLAASAARAQTTTKTEQNNEQNISGGQFTITKSVVAGGGAEMQNQSRAAQSTAGQTVAGGSSNGGAFSLSSGFWTPDNLAPTAAAVTVGGRVTTAQGNGIRNARVTIHFSTGETRSTLTGAFGFYRFSDIEAGDIYIFTVSSKRFVFPQATQAVTVSEERDDINFTAGY